MQYQPLEDWKEHLGSKYRIYPDGNVIGVYGRKVLKPQQRGASNILSLKLSTPIGYKWIKVHRLVALFHLDTFDWRKAVVFKDGNINNIDVSNLECIDLGKRRNRK